MKKMLGNRAALVTAAVIILVAAITIIIWVSQKGDTADGAENRGGVQLVTPDGEAFDYQKAQVITVGNYKGVKVEVEPDEEDIDLELSSVLDDLKMNKDNKKIKKGDYAYIDFTVSEDGEAREDLQEDEVLLLVGKYTYQEAFEDALIGREVGETYSVPLKFPDDYKESSMAGRTLDYRVTIKAKFDDAYAREASKGKCKDVKAYRARIAKRLRKENMENLGELCWDALMEQCKVNQYPKALVKEEIENLQKQYAGFADVSGMSYEELMESLMMDEESVKETAQDIVRDRMAAKTIARWEGFALDEETCRKYLIQLMDYEKDDDDTLEHFYEDYKEDYGSRPKDDILVAMAKDFVSGHAVIK